MDRRAFLTSLGLAAAGSQLACASVAQNVATGRRLRRVGIQLYTLRDDAKRDLERTLADIAGAGYKDVELLSSMNNFGMPPARLRQVLDQNGLRAPSTHVGVGELNDLDRQLGDAATLGHKYIVLASLPGNERTLDDYKRWADRLNDLGRRSLTHGVWIGFHNEAYDFPPIGELASRRVRMHRRNCRLQRIDAEATRRQSAGDQCRTFCDQRRIPLRAILLVERDQFALV